MITRILQDKRPIKGIYWEGWSAEVGDRGVTKIVPYEETGEMAMVTWFAIYAGDEIFMRYSAKNCLVKYEISTSPLF